MCDEIPRGLGWAIQDIYETPSNPHTLLLPAFKSANNFSSAFFHLSSRTRGGMAHQEWRRKVSKRREENVFDQLGFSREAATALAMKSALHRKIIR
jgi:hypothetical protein